MRQRLVLFLLMLCSGSLVEAQDLPDFTSLVEEHSASVVNISTVRNFEGRQPRGEELDDFFRRFFPPGTRRPPANTRPRTLGSGFIISDDGYILTNNHVVDGADEIVVRFSDRLELTAEVIGQDPLSDMALIKVAAEGLPVVRIGRSRDLKVGEWVLAIGSPFGFDYSVTAGIVSAKGRSLPTAQRENYVPFIQTDVAINPGNSGGPLFNLDGEVIGINSQIFSNSGGFMGVSFAIPIDVAMEVVAQLRETGRVSRGWLGVVIQNVNRDLAESFGLERSYGALVNQVLAGGPADAGGLLAGDVITSFNDQSIERSSELPHYVGRARAGSEATLTVVRDGERLMLALKIGELPENIADQFSGSGGRAVQPSSLGLALEEITGTVRDRLEISGGVSVLESAGAAADAGIRRGDIITRLNNRPILDIAGFTEIAEALPPGRSVPVLVIRGETPTFLPLRVPE